MPLCYLLIMSSQELDAPRFCQSQPLDVRRSKAPYCYIKLGSHMELPRYEPPAAGPLIPPTGFPQVPPGAPRGPHERLDLLVQYWPPRSLALGARRSQAN